MKVAFDQLKDILEIHKLPQEAEEELMRRIEAEIYPERNIAARSAAIEIALEAISARSFTIPHSYLYFDQPQTTT